MTLTNPGSTDVVVTAGAILLGPADEEFALESAVSLPAGKGATAQVSAVRPGLKGNVAAGTITRFSSPAFAALKASNAAALSGGAAEERAAATAADIAAIRAQAAELEKSESLKRLIVAERPHEGIILRSAKLTATPGTPSIATPGPGDLILLEVAVTVTALAIPSDVLEKLAVRVLAPLANGEFVPGTVTAVETGANQVDGDDGSFRSEVRLTGAFARNLSRDQLIGAVKGKSPEDAAAILRERYGIADPDVDLTPGWAPWLPRFAFRISVEVRQKSADPPPTASPVAKNDATRTATPGPSATPAASATPTPRR